MIPAPYPALKAVAAGLLLMALAGAAGWFANGWRHGAELADLQRAHAEFRAPLPEAARADVQANAATIRQAATGFAAIQFTLAPRMTALTKKLRNATPLPADCRPDAANVRNLDAAIDAANQGPLDSALAAPCLQVERPVANDFNAWQA